MRSKPREMTRHGGPPGRLEESGSDLVLAVFPDGPYTLPLSGVANPAAVADCLVLHVNKTPS
jgi:hypothetical protein